MIKYPLSFEVSSQSPSGVNSLFEGSSLDFPPIVCAIPPEFKGPGGGYSPEELLGLALTSCLIATFKVFAERAQLQFETIKASAKLTIDRNEKGVPEINKFDLTFTLTGVQDQEKAKTLLAESQKYCLVCNSLKSEKTFQYEFI